MSAVTASLCSTLVFVLFVSADQKIITAESGQDATLTCRAPNKNTTTVEWSRADLRDEYVLFYQNGHFDRDNQHPSFKNRVDLQDRQMKDGDVSLILKNVTINDAGTYECHVHMEEPDSLEVSFIYLHVVPPGQTGGYPAWMVGLLVVLGIPVVMFFVFCIYKKIKKEINKLHKQVGRSAGFSLLNSEPPSPVLRRSSYPTRRKTDKKRQKETGGADLHPQSPKLNCESVIEI